MDFNIVIAHYRPDIVSGAENSIADLVDEIHERFHCTMLVPGHGNLEQFYLKRGFTVWVHEVQTPRRLLPGLHSLQSRQLASRLKKGKVDAVLCNTLPAASRVGTACQMAGVPYAIYVRDLIRDHSSYRRLLDRANRIFTISKDLQDLTCGLTDPQKVFLTYNHIKPRPILDRFEQHRAKGERILPFHPHHPVVGLVGRITRYKQQDLFIKAVPQILEAVPAARFVIVGAAQDKEKEYEASVKNLAASLGVADRVLFMGHRSDNIEITSEFTVACLTSIREPLGRVIFEAQLIGIPLVVSNTGGPAETTVDEVTALQFSPTAPDAVDQFATQVIRLLKDPPLRERLANNGKEAVMNTFASRKPIQLQETLIETMITTQGSINGSC